MKYNRAGPSSSSSQLRVPAAVATAAAAAAAAAATVDSDSVPGRRATAAAATTTSAASGLPPAAAEAAPGFIQVLDPTSFAPVAPLTESQECSLPARCNSPKPGRSLLQNVPPGLGEQ